MASMLQLHNMHLSHTMLQTRLQNTQPEPETFRNSFKSFHSDVGSGDFREVSKKSHFLQHPTFLFTTSVDYLDNFDNLESVGQGWIGKLGKALLDSPSPLYKGENNVILTEQVAE